MRKPTDLIEPAPTRRRGLGPRTLRRKLHERASRKRRLGLVALGTVLAAGLVLAVSLVELPFRRGPATGDPDEGAAVAAQATWLMIGTVESDPSGTASWLSVISWDRERGRGFVMYIPRTTLVEIPGYGGGPDSVGTALALGRDTLLTSTVANLLGVGFEHSFRISDQGIRALFDQIEGIDLDIPATLERRDPDGRVGLIFSEGRQHLDGRRVAEYLDFVDESGDEIGRGARHSQVWTAFFERFRGEGGAALEELISESSDLFSTDAEPEALAGFLGKFAEVPATSVIFEILPVQPQGIDTGLQFYKPDADVVHRVVDRYLSGSRPVGAGEPGRRVQILNGNGVPGIGEQVAEQLVPAGFRVVLDGNANSFDFEITQIVVYSNSEEALDVAAQVREALEVGEVLVSRQRQSVVDVTVVVGKDYLARR